MLTLYKANLNKANHKLTLSNNYKDCDNQTYDNQLHYHVIYELAMHTARNKYEHKVRDVIEEIHDLCGDLSYREGILEEFYGDQAFARRIAKFVSSGYEPTADLTRYKCVDVVDIYLCLAYFSCMSGWKTSDINVLKKHQDMAYYLAIDSSATLWTTNDKEILSFCDGKVALELAKNSVLNGWTTDDKEILKLCRGEVALVLAGNSVKTGWTTNDKEILMLQKYSSNTITLDLAKNSNKNGWTTDDKEILSLHHGRVALNLAKNSGKTGWTTDDKEILSLHQGGVAFWLSKCQKLSTSDSKILYLVEAYRNQYNKRIFNLRKKTVS
ncbi:MAG: hypothetical protein NTX75_01830 [Proteobacteria bacterium]|nr:hypothetical protein [Pseudomonadota bacterium]